MEEKGMVDVSVDASYGGLSASAGYSESTAKSNAGSERKGFAYGQRITEWTYATFEITCFTKEKFALYELKDTIRPYVAADWKFVRTFTGSRADLQKTDPFKRVAKGFSVPKMYAYTASAGIKNTTKYTSSNSDSSTKVKEAINASLKASYGLAAGSASSGEDKNMRNTLQESYIKHETETERFITGVAGNLSCLDATTSSSSDCETMIKNAVAAIAKDVSQQTIFPSSKYTAHASIDEIVQGYFNDSEGFGAKFLAAMEDYYSYKECYKPKCPSTPFNPTTVTLVNGSGDKTIVYIGDDASCSLPSYRTIFFPDRKEFINPEYRNDHHPFTPVELCSQAEYLLRDSYLACTDFDDRYYVPDEHYCYFDGGSKHCWYPEDKFPVGDMWGSGGTKPFNECGQKCTRVCDRNKQC